MDHALVLHSAERPGEERDVEDVGVGVGREVLEVGVAELDREVRLTQPLLRPGDRTPERLDRRHVSGAFRVTPREASVAAPDLKDLRATEIDQREQRLGLVALGVGPNAHVTGTPRGELARPTARLIVFPASGPSRSRTWPRGRVAPTGAPGASARSPRR